MLNLMNLRINIINNINEVQKTSYTVLCNIPDRQLLLSGYNKRRVTMFVWSRSWMRGFFKSNVL